MSATRAITRRARSHIRALGTVSFLVLAVTAPPLLAVSAAPAGTAGGARPWMNTALPPDQRAALLEAALTMDERLSLLHGIMALPEPDDFVMPKGLPYTAGYIPGVPRLGIPALMETDASLGVANPHALRPGDGATALPSGLATAATWNPDMAYRGSDMVGDETARLGYNVLLGGGVNLTREARNGRNFEYLGEDPLLAGTLGGEAIRAIQAHHVIATVKHYALNSQETGRHEVNVQIGERAARESDLLAFEIAIEKGHPGSVMCSYNRVNGPWACDSDALLNGVLKGDWAYPGWVMSDWGAVPGVRTAAHGLDQQSGEQLDDGVYFGDRLKAAIASGEVPEARVHDMARRILRSLFTVGLFDHPVPKEGASRGGIDFAGHAQVSRAVAEQGIVLLKNQDHQLPLAAQPGRVAVIGGRADFGVLSGGGSAQVWPVGGPEKARQVFVGGSGELAPIAIEVFHPSSPFRAIKAKVGEGIGKYRPADEKITFTDGTYISSAVAAARKADVAIVFATQYTIEGQDVPDLGLPDGQDALIAAVAAVNPHTVVVLETGGPVLMPWLDKVSAVVEAWYPGSRGGDAIVDVLFGAVNPSGRLPITFPAAESQLPHPDLPGDGLMHGKPHGQLFDVAYTEGADVGYKWYASHALKPLFPFGYGLSYTRFVQDGLTLEQSGDTIKASFTVSNTGDRDGMDVAQLYLTRNPDGAKPRLLGWSKVDLKPGESRTVSVTVDPRLVADFDEAAHRWHIKAGTYALALGSTAQDLGDERTVTLDEKTMAP